jgi:SAM-dependent methyltransferase
LRWFRRRRRAQPSSVDWGDLRRLRPVSDVWGFDRGSPVDRHYIESFLEEHRSDVRGTCLELLNAGYTRRFGGDRVTSAGVLDIDSANRAATVTGDLTRHGTLAAGTLDCFILTQTLQHIYDVRAALANAYTALKPGGVLLITVPAIIKVHREPEDYWRFTADALRRLIRDSMPGAVFDVRTYGNLLASVAFLMGLAAHELTAKERDTHDHEHPLVVAARAVKPLAAG